MKILMYHQSYGCDTGCCGHAVAFFPEDFTPKDNWDYDPPGDVDRFQFGHPDSTDLATVAVWARQVVAQEYGEKHVADLDLDHSYIVDGEAC